MQMTMKMKMMGKGHKCRISNAGGGRRRLAHEGSETATQGSTETPLVHKSISANELQSLNKPRLTVKTNKARRTSCSFFFFPLPLANNAQS